MTKQAIIVDDEPLGIERIRIFLEQENEFEIGAECKSGGEAVKKIQEIQPDVVFLDIQMPDLDGFGVISRLQELKASLPYIVFVTAYDEYAVKAFEVNAVDYLLKPVQEERFQAALKRVQQCLDQGVGPTWEDQLRKALTQINQPTSPQQRFLKRIEIRSLQRTDYIDVDDVYWLESDSNYIEVHLKQGSHVARMTLADLEEDLDPQHFVRISRSAIINIDHVRSIQPQGRRGHEVVLNNNQTIPITRSFELLQDRMKFKQ